MAATGRDPLATIGTAPVNNGQATTSAHPGAASAGVQAPMAAPTIGDGPAVTPRPIGARDVSEEEQASVARPVTAVKSEVPTGTVAAEDAVTPMAGGANAAPRAGAKGQASGTGTSEQRAETTGTANGLAAAAAEMADAQAGGDEITPVGLLVSALIAEKREGEVKVEELERGRKRAAEQMEEMGQEVKRLRAENQALREQVGAHVPSTSLTGGWSTHSRVGESPAAG